MSLSRRMLLAAGFAHLMASPSRAGEQDFHAIAGPAFGSTCRIVLPRATGSALAQTIARSSIRLVDSTMSPFRGDSEIGLFNDSDGTDWTAVSSATATVVAAALDIARRTSGAYDPTVGGLVGRYGFGPIAKRAGDDYRGISVTGMALRKSSGDLTLDLCGIAKGYAADLIATGFTNCGFADFFIEVGGEVRARGRHPSGRAWRAGIERPAPGDRQLHCVVAVENLALATSGDLVNSYVVGGRRYCHIIDPSQARPADTGLASVSVMAGTAMEADALATGLFALGAEAGPDCAGALGLDALFLVRDGAGFRETMTGNFASRVL
jgi:thiamine biosynthesis lipoprotein